MRSNPFSSAVLRPSASYQQWERVPLLRARGCVVFVGSFFDARQGIGWGMGTATEFEGGLHWQLSFVTIIVVVVAVAVAVAVRRSNRPIEGR